MLASVIDWSLPSTSSEGRTVSTIEEQLVVLRQKLSLADSFIEDFGAQLVGAKEGDVRNTKVKVLYTLPQRINIAASKSMRKSRIP